MQFNYCVRDFSYDVVSKRAFEFNSLLTVAGVVAIMCFILMPELLISWRQGRAVLISGVHLFMAQ